MPLEPNSIALLLITGYGAISLFILLGLGLFGIPISDEILLFLAGYLISQGKLNIIPTEIAVILGTLIGVTVSYFVGYYINKASHPWLVKFQKKGVSKITRAKKKFARTGEWSILISYCIPGTHHITAFVVGTLGLPYRKFALFAYPGAIIWSTIYVFLGFTIHYPF